MNKQKFIELVENPSRITEKDAGILAILAGNYPYSPLIHTMLAKALQNTAEAKSSLASAAIRISDRTVLKEVIEGNFGQANSSEADTLPLKESAIGSDFENNSEAESIPENSISPPVPEQDKEDKSVVLQELHENLRKLKEQKDRFESPESSSLNRQGTLPEPLQELLRNKEEKEIQDPKRIEQIKLIDDFIKNSSSISRKYRSADDVDREQNDLTSAYAYTPPDLATENLAQIMVRQGKTDKAIDIYEKLILKYPKKKAYFASCIEKLKTT